MADIPLELLIGKQGVTALVVAGVSYAVLFAYSIYVLILNRKQAQVKDIMVDLVKEVKDIKEILKNK